MPLQHLGAIGLGLICALAGLPARAAAFPTRAVTMIVPFPAGSSTDAVARFVGERLSSRFGQPVMIENKAGADGILGAQAAARAAPDGHTLLFTSNSTHASNPNLYSSLPYDPVRDFAPIARILRINLVLVVRPDFPAGSVEDLLALARAQPGKLTFGHGNTSSRAAGELFAVDGKVELTRVPYRGNPQAISDLMGGRIDLMFADLGTAQELISVGTLRPLAVTSPARAPQLPAIPTVAETGLSGFDMSGWVAVFAPAGTPSTAVEALSSAIDEVVRSPEAERFLFRMGSEPFPASPRDLAAFVSAEMAKWALIVQKAKIEKQ